MSINAARPPFWKRIWERLIEVQHAEPGRRAQGRLLITILILPFLANLFFTAFQMFFDMRNALTALILTVGIFPSTILLARRGHVRAATYAFIIGFAAYIVFVAFRVPLAGRSAVSLVNLMIGLMVTIPITVVLLDLRLVLAAWLVSMGVSVVLGVAWYTAVLELQTVGETLNVLLPSFFANFLAGVAALLFVRTELKHRAQMTDQLRLLSAILETIPVGVAVFDADSEQPRYQNALVSHLTFPFDDSQERVQRLAFPFDDNSAYSRPNETLRQGLNRPWRGVARTGVPYTPNGYVKLSLGAETRQLQERAIPIRAADQQAGSPAYVVYTAIDVSPYYELLHQLDEMLIDQRSVAQGLRSQDQNRFEIFAIVGHEMRTPLNAIIARLELLFAEHQNDSLLDPVRQDMRVILAAAQDALFQANNLLDAATLHTRHHALDLSAFDLKQVINDVAINIEVLMYKKNLALRFVAPVEPVLVYADPRRVRQIVYNLLTNAYKFTEKGSVTIHIDPQPGDVMVHIIDTGVGIPPEQQERIFRRFEQGETEMAAPRSGSLGLGLAIARSLLLLQKGQLWLESTPGQGSSFSFSLPRAEPEAES